MSATFADEAGKAQGGGYSGPQASTSVANRASRPDRSARNRRMDMARRRQPFDDLVQLLSHRGKARVDEHRENEEHNAGKCFHRLLVLAIR